MDINLSYESNLEKIIDTVKRFFRKASFSYKALFSVMNWKQYVFMNLSSPLAQMICFAMLATYANGGGMEKWLVGNALVMTYFNAIFGVGSQLTRERNTGTLTMLIASPSNRLGILIPRATLHVFDGILTVAIGFIVAFLVFGLRLPLNIIPSLIIVLLAASFSAMAFGIIISCLGLLTRDLNLLLNVASMSLLGLTGANFPLSYLPKGISYIPWGLPLTRSIALSKYLISGQSLTDHWQLLLGEFLIGLIFIIFGLLMFKSIEKQAISKGTLEIF
jgi:ABC-2 type transport system permease protein